MNYNSVPKATLGRLPKYLEYLKELSPTPGETISSTAIAKALSLGDVQVRKDLAAVSGAGKPKIGYKRAKLIDDIERHLGSKKHTSAVLVGAGKLGRALLDYDGFREFGVHIVAGFDSGSEVISLGRGTTKILPIKDIKEFCLENDVQIGIITVGQGSAQEVCDILVASGVRAIWNFAPCELSIPEGIILKQENLALSLAYLNNQISK